MHFLLLVVFTGRLSTRQCSFGSIFQLVKSKVARRADGEHYTSEKNNLKTIEPWFFDVSRVESKRLFAHYARMTSAGSQ